MASYAESGEPSPKLLPQYFNGSDLVTDKRKLILIYIHGFCGTEESFGQFPSHIHSFLKQALGDTYVVYSKIYPQYETRNSMDIAVENFSRWLQPHENSQTDVILVGHSQGGFLAARAAQIKESLNLDHRQRHSIIGTISLDCPFLGLDPGIIVPGIISLFRPKHTEIETKAQLLESDSSSSRLLPTIPSASLVDAGFNPPFFNDNQVWPNRLPSEPKPMQSVWNSGLQCWLRENIASFTSHWAYGRCLRRPWTLRLRYHELRALEGYNESFPAYEKQIAQSGNLGRRQRIRFLNFFTSCTPRQYCWRSKISSWGNGATDKGRFFEQAGKDHILGDLFRDSDIWSTEVESLGHYEQSATDLLCLQERKTNEAYRPLGHRLRPYQPTNLLHCFSALLSKLVEFLGCLLSLFQGAPESHTYLEEERLTDEGQADRQVAVKPDEGRTFCILPPEADPMWVRISMEGTDEVGAHCSIFADNGSHYEKLVLRMGKEIVQWVCDIS
ncbi:hypothetical protein ACKRZS_006705 [Fusarium odoratissimum]